MTAELVTSTSGASVIVPPPAPQPWRESVLHGMLSVVAVVAPMLAALGIFVGATHRDPQDLVAMITAGLALPLLRFARGIPVRRRALVAILTLFATGIFLLARAGFAAGLSVVIVTTCVLGVVTLGRSLGLAMIAFSAAAHVVIGLLVSHGVLHLAAREVDPMLMRNWIRMALSTSLLAVLLANVIDFVIRHVEANARAATSVLAELQVAYERLGKLHGRLEAAKEEERRFLAHELHDELGQSLTALKLRLQLGSQALRRSAQRRDAAGAGAHRPADRRASAGSRSTCARRCSTRSGSARRCASTSKVRPPCRRCRSSSRSRIRATVRGWRPIWRSLAFAWCRNRSPTPFATPPRRHIQVRMVRTPDRVSLAIQRRRPRVRSRGALQRRRGRPPRHRRHARTRAHSCRPLPPDLPPGAGTSVEIDLPV